MNTKVGWFVAKYSNDALAWGLPFEGKLWVLLIEDSNKPSTTYLFKESIVAFLEKRHNKQVRDSAKNVDESSWPISAEQLADVGIFC